MTEEAKAEDICSGNKRCLRGIRSWRLWEVAVGFVLCGWICAPTDHKSLGVAERFRFIHDVHIKLTWKTYDV